MKRFLRQGMTTLALSTATLGMAGAAELRGSPASMTRQHAVAVESGYAFVEEPADALRLLDRGKLVELEGNEDYDVGLVRYRYALPETRTFIERLSAQYRDATGEKLVVTSLARPSARQPANAHRLSVHPAGMAVDLRVPKQASSRTWLENALLALERRGVLDVTREYYPPHYHVAVYPEPYLAYVEERRAAEAEAKRDRLRRATIEAALPMAATPAGNAEQDDRPVWLKALMLLLPTIR